MSPNVRRRGCATTDLVWKDAALETFRRVVEDVEHELVHAQRPSELMIDGKPPKEAKAEVEFGTCRNAAATG